MFFNIDKIRDYAKLKPCGNCGGEGVIYVFDGDIHDNVYIVCEDCEYHTKYIEKKRGFITRKHIDKAIKRWNNDKIVR